MLSIGYEELTRNPVAQMEALCGFVSIEAPVELSGVTPEANQFESVLDSDEITLVKSITQPVVDRFGYRFEKF